MHMAGPSEETQGGPGETPSTGVPWLCPVPPSPGAAVLCQPGLPWARGRSHAAAAARPRVGTRMGSFFQPA